MKTNANVMLVENYFRLLSGLGRENKIKIIAKLTNSIIEEEPDKNDIIDKLFGSFKSDKSAEEIIEEIKKGRNNN